VRDMLALRVCQILPQPWYSVDANLGVFTMSWKAMILHALRSVLKSRDASR